MKKLLQRLKRDCRGAVTVFVTLMLVPAVLISGTGVDLARLYVARSEIQDANQLAANATWPPMMHCSRTCMACSA